MTSFLKLDVSHFDISGKDDKNLQEENILFIFVAEEVTNFVF